MNMNTIEKNTEMNHLGKESRMFLGDCTNAVEEKIEKMNQRLSEALEHGKAVYDLICEKTVKSAKATDVLIHEKPYQAIAIGLGLGALIGVMLTLRFPLNRH
jgi:ElaB/YqjD/DUF883 family membrane-anchored ribosome-binding protein